MVRLLIILLTNGMRVLLVKSEMLIDLSLEYLEMGILKLINTQLMLTLHQIMQSKQVQK